MLIISIKIIFQNFYQSDRNETSRAQRRAELIENLKQFPGVVRIKEYLFS
jgi:hypothetical protein